MTQLRPKFITFDCYGTLTRFQMGDMARDIYADRVPPGRMDAFVKDFAAYRLDEVLGAWKPYVDVIMSAVERTCRKHGVAFVEVESRRFYDAVPTWGPHADVPEALKLVARHYPLVGLSNAADEQIHANVAMYGAPFHAVFTAEQARSYKPRMRGFEHMLDRLGASAGAAIDGSARPSVGACMPPIQSCSLPGVRRFAAAGVSTALRTWYCRAMSIQADQVASSFSLLVT